MSISNNNPFVNSRAKCLVHSAFCITPFIVKALSLSLLSVERIVFFYHPFWYERIMTNKRIIGIEISFIIFTMTVDITAAATGEIFFSPAMLFCSNMRTTWVFHVHMVVSYLPSIILVLAAVISLHRLIVKHRRTIAIESLVIGRSNGNSSEFDSITSVYVIENVPIDRCGPSSGVQELLVPNLKVAMKILRGISGVFWVTYVPTTIGVHSFSAKKMLEAELGLVVNHRILLRFLTFLITLGYSVDPLISLFVNPQLKSKLMALLRKPLQDSIEVRQG